MIVYIMSLDAPAPQKDRALTEIYLSRIKTQNYRVMTFIILNVAILWPLMALRRLVAGFWIHLPGQNGRHFAEDIFRRIFVNEKYCILI